MSNVASLTVPVKVNDVRKGMVVLLRGFPCKIVDIAVSKTGKHGHAKARFVGIDIFTGKKYEDVLPTSHTMEQPVITRGKFTVLDITDDGFMALMGDAGQLKEDTRAPPVGSEEFAGIRKRLDAGTPCAVTLLCAMGQSKVDGVADDK